jgi:hypothetical protein
MSTEEAAKRIDTLAKVLPSTTSPVLVALAIIVSPWLWGMFEAAQQTRNALLSVSTNLPSMMGDFRKASEQIEKIGERLDRHIEQTDRFHREVDGRIRKIEDKVGDLYATPRFETAKPRP